MRDTGKCLEIMQRISLFLRIWNNYYLKANFIFGVILILTLFTIMIPLHNIFNGGLIWPLPWIPAKSFIFAVLTFYMTYMYQSYFGGWSLWGVHLQTRGKKWRYFYTFSAPKSPKTYFLRRRRRHEKFLSTFFEIFVKFVNKNAIKNKSANFFQIFRISHMKFIHFSKMWKKIIAVITVKIYLFSNKID